MKIELDDTQLSLIINGLRALQESADYENRATRDAEIIEDNDGAIKEAGELIGYLASRVEATAPADAPRDLSADPGTGRCPSCGLTPTYEDGIVLLANLDYQDGEHGHVLYQVPADALDRARQAAADGHRLWNEAAAEEMRTVEDFIDAELRKAGVTFRTLEYDAVDLGC